MDNLAAKSVAELANLNHGLALQVRVGRKLMVFRHGLPPHFHEEQSGDRIDQDHHENRLNYAGGGVLTD